MEKTFDCVELTVEKIRLLFWRVRAVGESIRKDNPHAADELADAVYPLWDLINTEQDAD